MLQAGGLNEKGSYVSPAPVLRITKSEVSFKIEGGVIQTQEALIQVLEHHSAYSQYWYGASMGQLGRRRRFRMVDLGSCPSFRNGIAVLELRSSPKFGGDESLKNALMMIVSGRLFRQ